MNKNRITAFLLTLTVAAFSAFCVSAEPEDTPKESETTQTVEFTDEDTDENNSSFPAPRAKSAILYDLNGGRIIYSNNSNEKNYPASVTKIMTAMLALEKGNLTDTITVSESALADITYLHSKLGLKTGEQISLENLLTALMVCSANDAANVIAEYISGDIASFVALMNTRAAELGMTGTNFVNPHGFHDDNHYTTAADIAVLAREAIKNTKFCELAKIKTAKIPATNMSEERMISSTNHLISRYRNTFHYYPYATGLKTGSTDEAGNCLVATAEKNGISLLSVVLGCENENDKELAYSFVDTKAMFEYIFNNYKTVTIATTADIISDSKVYEAKDSTRVALSPSADIIMLLPKDYSEENIKQEIKLEENISAPIEKGVRLGSVVYSFANLTGLEVSQHHIGVDLLAANEVKLDYFLHFIHAVGNILLSPFVLIPLILIAAVLIINAVNRNKRRQQRRRRMKSQHTASYRNGYRTQQTSSARRRTTSRTRTRTSGYSTSRRTTSSANTRRRPSNLPSRTPDPWDKYR
ncbi:MAG: D-alanyl-D-alanine carboxypeptidase [Clostridia bacterium]|nr:D-alanyl-D-alanine carboxypeptidase [Clostridia bacterium]